MKEKVIPVLTDLVTAMPAPVPAALGTEELAELQTRIVTGGYAIVERLLHESLQEMEANLFADVIGRLRLELPELVEETLHQHFNTSPAGPGRAS